MKVSILVAALAAPAAAQVVRTPVRAGAAPVVPAVSFHVSNPGLTGSLSAPRLTAPVLSAPTLPSAPSLKAPAAAVVAAPAAVVAVAAVLPAAALAQAPAVTEAPAAEGLQTLSRSLARRTLDVGSLNAAFDGAAQKEEAAEAAAMARPPLSSWSMLGKEYKTTQELLAAVPDQAEPVPAVYTYGHNETTTRGERRANMAIGAVTGAFVLAEVGAVLGAIGGALGPILNLFLGGYGGSSVGLADIAVIGAFLGGFGACVGLMMGKDAGAAAARTWVHGEILRYKDKLYFRPSGAKAPLVDLSEFAQAPVAPEAPAPAPWPLWKRAGVGAGLGLLVALATGFPLVQIVGLWIAGPAAGVLVGQGLSGKSEVSGAVLGGALGTLVPVSYFAMLSVANALAYGAVWGAMGLWLAGVVGLGALLGAALGNPVRRGLAWREGAFPQSQWWARGQR